VKAKDLAGAVLADGWSMAERLLLRRCGFALGVGCSVLLAAWLVIWAGDERRAPAVERARWSSTHQDAPAVVQQGEPVPLITDAFITRETTPAEQMSITIMFSPGLVPIMTFRADGRIEYRGRLLVTDKEIVDGMRALVEDGRRYNCEGRTP